jgi:hypothetical protein
MTEDIASRDYEAEIYILKAEIKRLEERDDLEVQNARNVESLKIAMAENEYLRNKKDWYHEEHAKEMLKRVALEAEIEALKCCGNCKSFHHCQFRLSDADVIVKPPENFDCDKWEDRK